MGFRNVTPIQQTDTARNPGSQVSVGAADTLIAAANGDRVEITITNDHATQVVYLKLGAAGELNKGIRLNAAGGSYTTNAYTGEIRGFASGAATIVLVAET
jgi:hypothetical protein